MFTPFRSEWNTLIKAGRKINIPKLLAQSSEEILTSLNELQYESKVELFRCILKEHGESAMRALIDKCPSETFPTTAFSIDLILYWRNAQTEWREVSYGIEPDEIYELLNKITQYIDNRGLMYVHHESICDLEIGVRQMLLDATMFVDDVLKSQTIRFLKTFNYHTKLELVMIRFNLQRLRAESDMTLQSSSK